MKYILYTLCILGIVSCTSNDKALGPAHNYEVPEFDTIVYQSGTQLNK